MTEQLLTVADVVARLRISDRTIRRLIAAGQLRPVRIGSRTLFTEKELAAFVAASQRRRVA